MKKASFTAGRFALIGAAFSLAFAGCGDAESEAKANALELEDVSAYWAVRGKDREQNNYIHPVVRFRIKNGGSEEAGYIQAMAVFKRESFPDEPWGNDFLYSISDAPIAPGARSEILTMRSDTNFVSKDAPEQMFQNEKWEEISVAVFLRVGPSSWKPALSLEVPKQIGAPGLEKFIEPEEATKLTPETR
ncbi:MAG TPA: hypothetical protein VJ921_11450 [Vicinamibacteria bacterium]|nr:hypothetical protein [Vicinamibacteria bacterium]